MKGFSEPSSLAISPGGLLYVTDPDNNHFRELDLAGHTLGVFGRSGSGDGQFRSMEGIAVLDDTVYICDPKTKRITVLSAFAADGARTYCAGAGRSFTSKPGTRVSTWTWIVSRGTLDGTLHTLSIARGFFACHP